MNAVTRTLQDVTHAIATFFDRTDFQRGYDTADARLREGYGVHVVESIQLSAASFREKHAEIIRVGGARDAFDAGFMTRVTEEKREPLPTKPHMVAIWTVFAESIGDLVEKMKTKTQNPEEEIAG